MSGNYYNYKTQQEPGKIPGGVSLHPLTTLNTPPPLLGTHTPHTLFPRVTIGSQIGLSFCTLGGGKQKPEPEWCPNLVSNPITVNKSCF